MGPISGVLIVSTDRGAVQMHLAVTKRRRESFHEGFNLLDRFRTKICTMSRVLTVR